MRKRIRLLVALFILINFIIVPSPSFQVFAEQTADEEFQPEDITPLKDLFADYFYIGAAVEPQHLIREFGQMLEYHYNMIVAENVMKPESIIQSKEDFEAGNFNWTNADILFDYAEKHGMKMRYHTLVWHNQTPNWFFLDEDGNEMIDETDPEKREANKELLLERMRKYITAVVERYKGRVEAWDVVNEVMADDEGNGDGLRESKWLQITGTDYIEEAFKLVRELDPDAKLVINDYNTHIPSKRDYLYDLIVDLQEKGTPIDGVGHQTHISISYPAIHEIGESIEKFASLGLDNEITELDLSIYSNDSEFYDSFDEIPEFKLERQARKYEDLFEEFKRLHEHISSVVFWGIADIHTWKHNFPVEGRTDAPFVFDENFKAKPAYYAIAGIEPDEEALSEEEADVENEVESTTNTEADDEVADTRDGYIWIALAVFVLLAGTIVIFILKRNKNK